jgi:catechol 2,3-dioxygenase-like lactoylglutathione lyase family enzyme
MVVSDTDTSLRFFRDTLGLQVVGNSENYGTEQEHLNQVFGARLRISALRTATGPGIEFLEYLTPTDGRPMPSSERLNDLYHWQTRLVTTQLVPLAQALRNTRTPFISENSVELPSHVYGFSKNLLVRDPTGHVLHLVER